MLIRTQPQGVNNTAFWDRIKKIGFPQPAEGAQIEKADPCEEKAFAPWYQQKKINVFVSSTFRDMKEERDELTLRVFPALRKVCEERGIAWGEVDLRWGIPEEKKGEVLSTCLKFIDECRPYFIGMLGERYGWIEETVPEGVTKDYPWITDHKGKSITELEILHGVLNNPAMAGHAYFYFRDSGFLNTLPTEQRPEFLEGPIPEEITKYGANEAERFAEKRRRQLAILKETIRRSGVPVREGYPDPVRFGELVQEDLMLVIDSLAPPPKPLSDAEHASATLDREDMAHEAFAASRFGVYIPRQEYFDRLDAHVAGDSPPLVVLGKSGSGKSALLAHWAFRYRLRHPDDFILVHFIGASSDSTDWTDMLRRFMGEFKRKFSLPEEIPAQDDALIATFANWLSMAATHGRVVLVIDALNQLEDRNGAPDLVWLPPTIPGNIRLIVSTLEGRPLDAVRKRGWPTLDVEPLTVSERNALITCYLKKYHKELSPSMKQELASAPQSENPLFLRALLEEIRIHGVFEKLVDQIRVYLSAQTVDALYEMILSRYEHDYERDRPGLVKGAVSLIWAARRGLSKSELMDLLGTNGKPLPAAYWAPLYLAMEHSLVEKDGRITFFHDYLRTAVEHRYLPVVELKREVRLWVADYFAIQPEGLRRIEELPWQLAEAAEWDRLVALLADPIFFMAAWDVREYDVKQYWVLAEAGSSNRMIEAYRQIIQKPARFPPSLIWALRLLLYGNGHLEESFALGEFLIKAAREGGDQILLQKVLGKQSGILIIRGNLDEAKALLKEQEEICRAIGDMNGLMRSLGDQGTIFNSRGFPNEAMSFYKEQEKLCRQIGNMQGLHRALGNQANIFNSRGQLNEAMALSKEQERICRELGDLEDLQISLHNQATVLYARGYLDEAMINFTKEEQICRELGNVAGVQRSLGSQAIIQYSRGHLDEAMALSKEQERICRELGAISCLAGSLVSQAFILQACGDLEGSMIILKEQENVCREQGNRDVLEICLCYQAIVFRCRDDINTAMELLKEQEKICREIGKLEGLARSFGFQAGILQASGDLDGALALLDEEEKICQENGIITLKQQVNITRAQILTIRGDFDDAMILLKELEQISRELGIMDGLQRSLGEQATIQYLRGNPHREMILLEEQEQICREVRCIESLARLLTNKALNLFDRKRHAEAISAAEEAYKLASSHGYTALAKQILPFLERIRREK